MKDRRRWSSEKGAQVIEFALVLPLLLVVFAGIVDFGLIFQRYEVVVNAAREGARVASLPAYTSTEIENRVNAYLDASLGPGTSGNASVTMVGGNLTPAVGPAYPVRTVTVALADSYWLLGPLATLVGAGAGDYSTITLTAIATMRMQTPGP